ncbi:stealth conserved region 3 domain-containing protein [Streptomyces spectabilis]|uniref:Glycosyltransferase n=1 Tax=Streptomyces spectabilis TaxID=68270 RepID=A0A5P2X9F7_STRST|nr:stealth conserved region 3 domain-containing protein [Streptomyces spectabilis]MBB5106465.1 glycosyltransferase involved in cell wall biosynthesis [Streptomyces spectabilis]MCI3903074.1 stealth conserved region 3 domain-containing protein [Streptomyces spectabilis]QEV60324.1 glycosyltransferase [Streptomyces spectabilis]GGV32504.1 exopolysaccharide phosphotransferase [Streptomyces spectabilis]
MKITYLLGWGDEMGGTELATYTQALHLAERHDVEVLSVFRTRTEPFFPEARGLAVRYLVDRTATPERPVRGSRLDEGACRTLAALPSELIAPAWESAFDRLADVELTAALTDLDTDVLVTTTPALLAAAARLVPARVVTVHQEHRPTQRRGPSGEPLLLFAPRLDALVTLTERTREWIAESLGATAPELAVIPNAVPDGFRPRADGGSKVIVMAARLTGEKRVDHAVRAFARLADAHPDWTLRIFGGGHKEPSLRRLVDAFGLQDRVELLGPCQDMAAEWAKAGLTLMTAGHNEAFPLVLLEALAAGVPVIAYDVLTGPAEIVRHRVDGLLVPPGEIEQLATAMAELMSDDVTRLAYARAAREGVYARFSSERVTALWEELYARLVAGRDRPERLAERADRVALGVASGGPGFRPTAPHTLNAPAPEDERAREDEILAAHEGLIRSVGRLAEQRDDVRTARMAAWNLELTAAALEAWDVPYVLVRTSGGSTAHTLAVADDHRDAALKALADALHGRAVYAELVAPRDAAPGVVLAERLDSVGEMAGLRVFKPVTTTTLSLRHGVQQACTVAFWTRTGEPEGGGRGWRAPFGSTLAGSELPSLAPTARLRVGEREYPSAEVFTQLLMKDVDFPVDAVYTWVDDTDPAWRAARAAALGGPGDGASADTGAVRFRNRDELRYSLRSLAMYAPWVRHVYLVTAGQVPAWLDEDHPGLTVVDHRDLFADPDACLPTFNSHAIETQLHRIDGLSEHFLYFNDDMFLGRPTTPDTFFLPSGLTRFFWSSVSVPDLPVSAADEGYLAAAKNNRALLRRDFGRTATHCLLHVPYALRRDVLTELAERYGAELAATARNPFRGNGDHSVVSSLHQHYAYLTGRAVPGSLAYDFVDIGARADHARLGQLLQSRNKTAFCVGETPGGDVSDDETTLALRAFLTAYFPVPSPYERGAGA